MIQIIPNRKKSFSEHVLEGVNAASPALQQFLQKRELQNQMNSENEILKRKGLDLSGITDPKKRQDAFQYFLEGQKNKSDYVRKLAGEKELQEQKFDLQDRNKTRELGADAAQNEKSYNLIAETFGTKFADIWKVAPVGGQTELLRAAIDAKSRGQDINDLLTNVEKQQNSQGNPSNVEKKSGEFEWPDYSKPPSGYNQKDWNQERKTWRGENVSVYQANETKLKNDIRDSLDIKKLKQINPKMPKGFEKIIINPETGEFYGAAQLAGLVSPEAQEYVKIFSRFQNRAKDAFGSRVTNFDLASYMKQFPGLLNTGEGRDRILRMMTINNELDQLHGKAISKVYKKYGLSGIPQEEANKLAEDLIKDKVDKLEAEYLKLDDENVMQSSESSNRKRVPQGTKLGQDAIQMYFEMANGDPVVATQMAEEDGYDVPQ